jgi:hypothetical protein
MVFTHRHMHRVDMGPTPLQSTKVGCGQRTEECALTESAPPPREGLGRQRPYQETLIMYNRAWVYSWQQPGSSNGNRSSQMNT